MKRMSRPCWACFKTIVLLMLLKTSQSSAQIARWLWSNLKYLIVSKWHMIAVVLWTMIEVLYPVATNEFITFIWRFAVLQNSNQEETFTPKNFTFPAREITALQFHSLTENPGNNSGQYLIWNLYLTFSSLKYDYWQRARSVNNLEVSNNTSITSVTKNCRSPQQVFCSSSCSCSVHIDLAVAVQLTTFFAWTKYSKKQCWTLLRDILSHQSFLDTSQIHMLIQASISVTFTVTVGFFGVSWVHLVLLAKIGHH